ncbi:hypothetical protein V6Z11_A13G172200 [Gossypium hirsutum]
MLFFLSSLVSLSLPDANQVEISPREQAALGQETIKSFRSS